MIASFREIKSELNQHIDELASRIFGKYRRTRLEIRSAKETAEGFKLSRNGRWYWFNHKSEGGSLFEAIAHHMGLQDWRAGAEWAATEILGWQVTQDERGRKSWNDRLDDAARAIRQAQRKAAEDSRARETAAEDGKKAALVNAYVAQSVPIDGTLGERYLVERRGIPKPGTGWPSCIRWHERKRALICVSTAITGEVDAIQRIHLTADGDNVRLPDGRKKKLTMRRKCSIRLPAISKDATGPFLIAEGPETGLSAWVATGLETMIVTGSVAGADIRHVAKDRPVVVLLDDDKMTAQSRRKVRSAIWEWMQSRSKVVFATPWEAARYDKSDMNDALKAHGPEYVAARIRHALTARVIPEGMPIDAARQITRRVMREAFDTAINWKTVKRDSTRHEFEVDCIEAGPVIPVAPDAGVGKTAAALDEAIISIRQGALRSVTIAVPTHALGSDTVRRARQMAGERGIAAATWRGRDAIDPLGDGERLMCVRPKEELQAIGAARGSADLLCKVGEERCAFYESCGYQRQKSAMDGAKLAIVPHASLVHVRPSSVPFSRVIVVDEAIWPTLVPARPSTIPVEDLSRRLPVYNRDGRRVLEGETTDLWASLQPARDMLLRVLERTRPGTPILREELVKEGLTWKACSTAASRVWKAKIDLSRAGVGPQTPAAELKRFANGAAGKHNARVAAEAGLWSELAEALETIYPLEEGQKPVPGPLGLSPFVCDDRDGLGRVRLLEDDSGARIVNVYRLHRIHDSWLADEEGNRASIIALDATWRDRIMRTVWLNVLQPTYVKAAAPHQHVYWVADTSFSQSTTKPGGRRVAEIAAFADKLAVTRAGDVLLVTQKPVEQDIRDRNLISRTEAVRLGHHNALRGIDTHGDVAAVVVAGRTLPPPREVESLAEIASGRAVTRISAPSWYDRRPVTVESMAGQVVTLEVDRHPDQLAEAFRGAIADDEIVQLRERSRGVNRTARNPVDVYVAAGGIEPSVQVTAFAEWGELGARDPDLEALARHGVWVLGSGDFEKITGVAKGNLSRLRRDLLDVMTLRNDVAGAPGEACEKEKKIVSDQCLGSETANPDCVIKPLCNRYYRTLITQSPTAEDLGPPLQNVPGMTELEAAVLDRMWLISRETSHLVPFIYVAEPGTRRPERTGFGVLDKRVVQPADARQWLSERLGKPVRTFSILNLRAGPVAADQGEPVEAAATDTRPEAEEAPEPVEATPTEDAVAEAPAPATPTIDPEPSPPAQRVVAIDAKPFFREADRLARQRRDAAATPTPVRLPGLGAPKAQAATPGLLGRDLRRTGPPGVS